MSTASSLLELDHGKLVESAKSLSVATEGLTDIQLANAIEKAAIKRTLRAEREAKAELDKEYNDTLGVLGKKKRRPSIQDVAMRNSRKVIALFKNMEHPAADGEDGADLMFTCGQQSFHLYDNHRFVMPECLVTDEPMNQTELQGILQKFWEGAGLPQKRAQAQAISDLLQMSLPRRCSYPIHELRTDPRDSTRQISVLVRNEPRFFFQIFGDAPKDAELGDLADPENASDALKSNEQLIAEGMAPASKGARPPRRPKEE